MRFELTKNNFIKVTSEAEDKWEGVAYGGRTSDHPECGMVLKTTAVKVKGKRQKQSLSIRISGRPELSAMVDEMNAIRDAKAHKEKSEKEEHEAAIDDSRKPIRVHFNDGEYLSAYAVHGYEAEKMVVLGLAKYVDGWGYRVESNVVESLG